MGTLAGMRRMFGAAVGSVLTLVFAAAPAPGHAASRLPTNFVGMNLDQGTLALSPGSLARQLRLMAGSGAGAVRFPIYWADVQPIAGQAPDLAPIDRLVGGAARAGLRSLPTVLEAPAWARQFPNRPFSPPAQPAQYAAFLSALVARYGPRGSFWAQNPGLRRLPIHDWQVWNEESGSKFWTDDDQTPLAQDRVAWTRPYLALLTAARAAVRRADSHARIVLGGLFGESWTMLAHLYAADPAAVRRSFDVMAVHPYTAKVINVEKAVRFNRAVLRRYGDGRKPIVMTEWGWPSSVGHLRTNLGFEATSAQQAQRLADSLRMLSRDRRSLGLESIWWYDWAEPEAGISVFDYSGLWRRRPDGRMVAKPALGALRRTVRALRGR
jgi:polysaccharide biosynthesis protein PslG